VGAAHARDLRNSPTWQRTRIGGWHVASNVIPVESTIDAVGRVVVPKALRDALGLTPGSTVDISRYGAGLQITPGGRTARLVEEGDRLVFESDTVVDDRVLFGLIDDGRR